MPNKSPDFFPFPFPFNAFVVDVKGKAQIAQIIKAISLLHCLSDVNSRPLASLLSKLAGFCFCRDVKDITFWFNIDGCNWRLPIIPPLTQRHF